MKEIPLTQGQVALIDDEDFERVNKFKWQATKKRNGYYARRSVYGGNSIYLHSFIMNTRSQLDHIDHNGLNCQKINLRLANHSQNQQNTKKKNSGTSQYKGVSWNGKKWFAQIKINGITKYIGLYDNEIDAAKAYDLEAEKLFGEFAQLNFSSDSSYKVD